MKDVTLNIEALKLTLTELGWNEQPSANPKMALWVPSSTAKLELNVFREEAGVFLPQDTKAPDFKRLLQRAVKELTEFSADNVLEELDISRLRIERTLDKFVVSTDGAAVHSGLVDWQIGANLVSGLSGILMSGARAAHQVKAWYCGASNTIAKNYLDSCLMGQTEVGSYVVKAFSPAHATVSVSNSAKKKQQSQISVREVSKTVFAAVQATKEVLEEYTRKGDPEAFEWAMTQGVSVEMLGGFRDLIGNDDTEISVEFISTDADKPNEKPYRGAVVLSPTLSDAVEAGVVALKKSPVPSPITVDGEVVELKRVWDEPDSRRIKLRAPSPNGGTRIYTVHLDQEDYAKAVESHTNQVLFRVNGTAEKGQFINVENVRVIDSPVGGGIAPSNSNEGEKLDQLDLLSEHKGRNF